MSGARSFRSWFYAASGCACTTAAIVACASEYGASTDPPNAGDVDASADADPVDGRSRDGDMPVLPECPAQRVVHIVNGTAGLAWYTLVWPNPVLVDNFQAGQKYDDLTLVAKTIPDDGGPSDHPLYERKIAGRPIWQGLGQETYATVFVVGTNQTLTNDPDVTRLPTIDAAVPTTDVIAAGSIAQAGLAAPLPVLAFQSFYWVQVDGGPPQVRVDTIDQAIAAIRMKRPLSAAEEQELRPDPSTVATWYDATVASVQHKALAENLLFTANAFRMGLVSTVLMRGVTDDPYNAFQDVPTVTKKANNITRILDAFYLELSKSNEKACGHDDHALSLADNVLTLMSGDTPDNSFGTDTSWSNGTPQNLNLLCVRANGFLVPGWFGRYTANARVNFDPNTGDLLADASTSANKVSQTAALLGVYYAITRGDAGATRNVRDEPFVGVVSQTQP